MLFLHEPSRLSVDMERGLVYGIRRTLVGTANRDGYIQVGVRINGKGSIALAHRMVWETYAKAPIPAGLVINHKNGIRDDNRLDNLELVTPQQNVDHAVERGSYVHTPARMESWRQRQCRLGAPRGLANGRGKLSDEDILAIRQMASSGVPGKDIAAKFSVSSNHVSNVIRGKRRQILGSAA